MTPDSDEATIMIQDERGKDHWRYGLPEGFKEETEAFVTTTETPDLPSPGSPKGRYRRGLVSRTTTATAIA